MFLYEYFIRGVSRWIGTLVVWWQTLYFIRTLMVVFFVRVKHGAFMVLALGSPRNNVGMAMKILKDKNESPIN